MKYTVGHTAEDNGEISAFGTFTTRKYAEAAKHTMEASLDPFRDAAGGGVGDLQVVRIQSLEDWQNKVPLLDEDRSDIELIPAEARDVWTKRAPRP